MCLRCGKEVWIFIVCWESHSERAKSYIKTTHNMSGSLSLWSTIIGETLHKRRHQKPLHGDKKCKFPSYVSLKMVSLLLLLKPCLPRTWRLLIFYIYTALTMLIYVAFICAAWMECIRWMTSNSTVYKYPHLLSFDTLSNGFICSTEEVEKMPRVLVVVVGVAASLAYTNAFTSSTTKWFNGKAFAWKETNTASDTMCFFIASMPATTQEFSTISLVRRKWHCVIYYEHISLTLNV